MRQILHTIAPPTVSNYLTTDIDKVPTPSAKPFDEENFIGCPNGALAAAP